MDFGARAAAGRAQRSGALDKMQQAATRLGQAAQEGGAGPPAAARGVTRVPIERPRFNLKDHVWSSMPGGAAGIGQATAALFITFFPLASDDSFRRKIVRLAGQTLARRKLTEQTPDEITSQVQRYLAIQVLISVLVGGAVVLTAGAALVGFVQFGSLEMAALVGGVSMAVHVVSGNLLTPWLTSQASRLNAVTVFVGVLAFGWLWGLWGLVLGVPVLIMIKSVCDRIDHLQPVGDMLGR